MLNISGYTNIILLFLPINNISISLSTYHNSFHTLYEELNLTSFYVHYTLSLSFFLSFFLSYPLSIFSTQLSHTISLTPHFPNYATKADHWTHFLDPETTVYSDRLSPPPISDAFDKREYFFCIIQTIQL